MENFKNIFKNMDNGLVSYGTKLSIKDEIPMEMPKFETDRLSRLMSIKDIKEYQNYLKEQETFDPNDSIKEMVLKDSYNDAGMFAFVSYRWLLPFIEWINGRKVLEVMAGRGWLTYGLRQKGVDVHATDDFSWSQQRGWRDPLTDVEEMDAVKSIDVYGKESDIVIMGWPYMDNTAYQVLKRLHEVNPSALLVYIGERGGGCTADYDFHDHYELIDDEDFHKAANLYQSWAYIRDGLFVGRYRE